MPPRIKFTKEDIINSCIDIIRQNGADCLSARAIAKEMGSSVKPIFSVFENMDELKKEVIRVASDIQMSYMYKYMESGKYPPYKASGLAYINFAKQEKELFKLLYMRDRTGEDISDDKKQIKPIIDVIVKNTNLSEEEAYNFHTQMWIYVHGMATMIATSYLDWDIDFIDRALTDEFIGLKYRFCGGNVDERN